MMKIYSFSSEVRGKGGQELRLWAAGLQGPAVCSTKVYINVEHKGGTPSFSAATLVFNDRSGL